MDKILLSHGSGGKLMHELVDSLFIKRFDNPALRERGDSAVLNICGRKMAFTTDSYVVDPIFFPGGDIGSLAVYGTVNDMAVCGALPLYISFGIIIEEGFDKKLLARITDSAALAAKRSGVKIVTGDTKVVGKGSCDGIFINTSGIGAVFYDGLSVDRIRPGDTVIVSGPIGDHAIAVLSKREGMDFRVAIKSDSAPINGLIRGMLLSSKNVKFMRDPTRGGLGTTLNEIVRCRKFGISIDESLIPLRSATRQACELLGLDPMYLACEGRVVAITSREDAGKVLKAMRRDPLGKSSGIIGKVTDEYEGKVCLKTISGGKRIIDMLPGEQLPRIC